MCDEVYSNDDYDTHRKIPRTKQHFLIKLFDWQSEMTILRIIVIFLQIYINLLYYTVYVVQDLISKIRKISISSSNFWKKKPGCPGLGKNSNGARLSICHNVTTCFRLIVVPRNCFVFKIYLYHSKQSKNRWGCTRRAAALRPPGRAEALLPLLLIKIVSFNCYSWNIVCGAIYLILISQHKGQ